MPKLIHFKNQKFRKLRKNCQSKNTLFSDPVFPANDSILFYSKAPPNVITWKRPGDICGNPKFFTGSASAEDFVQGCLGNCWFVSACASVAAHPDLLKRVIPNCKDQEWCSENNYVGIFRFKFWQMGGWTEVVIDDLLPTNNGKLIFAHSIIKNEFWSPLLEKAYAKLFGSYEALLGGKARDALVDMTGGVGESIRISEHRSLEKEAELFKSLHYAFENKALISASIMAASRTDTETDKEVGLVKGHSYSITAVKKLKIGKSLLAYFRNEKVYMVRCQNPWGGIEWKGAWSDGSPEWNNVSESVKKELGLTSDHCNGEFWMEFENFCQFFTDIDICHILNTKILTLKKTWKEFLYLGKWEKPNRCGGCGNNENFLNNPQYMFRVGKTQEILFSLEQSETRSVRKKGEETQVIGFTVLRADIDQKYRVHNIQYDKVHSGPFSNARGVFARVLLKKGIYCIIPSTFNAGITGDFLLRIYAALNFKSKQLIKDGPKTSGLFKSKYLGTSSINVFRGEQLFPDDHHHKVYCVVICEKKKQKTPIINAVENFRWNSRATFFRRKPEEDIRIEVWEKTFSIKKRIGFMTVPMAREYWSKYRSMTKTVRYTLECKVDKYKKYEMIPKYLWLIIEHSEQLDAL